jgi:hypothetical protein
MTIACRYFVFVIRSFIFVAAAYPISCPGTAIARLAIFTMMAQTAIKVKLTSG